MNTLFNNIKIVTPCMRYNNHHKLYKVQIRFRMSFMNMIIILMVEIMSSLKLSGVEVKHSCAKLIRSGFEFHEVGS